MKIGLRGGHSANVKGASGYADEYNEMQLFYLAVKALLEINGHTVINCNSNAFTQGAELSEGCTEANNNNVDLFISLHMNASNGEGHGVEALVSSQNSRAIPYAQRLCDNFSALGFQNRGVKYERFYEMNHIQAPNVIFELCFCDSAVDMEIYKQYSWGKLAGTFCNSIDSAISVDGAQEGKWIKGSVWWYQYNDGTYPISKWLKIDNSWYYFDQNGYIKTGWFQDSDDKWYLLYSNGKMAVGWVEDRNTWYYMDANGAMVTGWHWINGECYYFNKDGKMACNCVTDDGYTVDSTGAWDNSIPKK